MEVLAERLDVRNRVEIIRHDILGRRLTLEQELDDCAGAFQSWEAASQSTDQKLYRAVGQLYILVMTVRRDMALIKEIALARGIQVTKASTVYTLTTKLVFATDRQKISKYAGAVRFLESRSVELDIDAIVAFIKRHGGIEATLRILRQETRGGPAASNPGPQSRFRKATARLTTLPACVPPGDLDLNAVSGPYFLLVGVRDATGRARLVNQPVQDGPLIRKVIGELTKQTHTQAR